MKQNSKLVRDKIVDIIKAQGEECEFHVACGWEYKDRLFEKMQEEMKELWDDPSIEEAADVYEVFMTLLYLFNLNFEDVVGAAVQKRNDHGGFRKGHVLKLMEK